MMSVLQEMMALKLVPYQNAPGKSTEEIVRLGRHYFPFIVCCEIGEINQLRRIQRQDKKGEIEDRNPCRLESVLCIAAFQIISHFPVICRGFCL